MGISPSPGKRKAIQIAVTLCALAGLAYTVDFAEAANLLRRADARTLIAMAILFPIDRIFMAWKWFLLARAREPGVSFWTGTRIYLGSSIGMFLPIGGLGPDVVRTTLLARHGMAAENAVASILVERVCGIAGSLLMLMTAGALLITLLPGTNAWMLGHLPRILLLTGATAVFIVAAALITVRIGLWQKLGAAVGRRPALRKFAGAILAYSGHYRLLGVSVLLSWLEQLAPIIAFYLAARGFGVPLSFLQCAAIIPLASVLERLPISFAGLGVREAGIVLVAGWFGISSTEAFLVSLFEQSVFIVTMIPLSLLYFAGRNKMQESV